MTAMNNGNLEQSVALHEWYALRVKSNRDQVVASHLFGRGYDTFVPTYKVPGPTPQSPPKSRPLLAGYVFCRLNLSTRLPVLTVPGVLGIVGIGKAPQPIPDDELESLRQVTASPFRVTPTPQFVVGGRVRIEAGPLCGAVGTVLDCRRGHFVVSITLLQRSVSVMVPPAWLVSASANFTHRTAQG